MDDKQLLLKIKKLVSKEREILGELLSCLQEVHERRLYAELGYSSLFSYLVEELGYSKGAAARRVNSLRLVQKVPEAKVLIAEGKISLNVAADTQRLCKELNREKIKSVLPLVIGKTGDDALKTLMAITNKYDVEKKRETVRIVSPEEKRLMVTFNNEVFRKLEKIKASNKLNLSDTLEFLIDKEFFEMKSNLLKRRVTRGTTSRNIPSAIKKEVLLRAQFECEFPGCKEVYNLEFEHITPFSKGGKHDIDNLLLYCKAHNQRAAIKEFGLRKMSKYIN